MDCWYREHIMKVLATEGHFYTNYVHSLRKQTDSSFIINSDSSSKRISMMKVSKMAKFKIHNLLSLLYFQFISVQCKQSHHILSRPILLALYLGVAVTPFLKEEGYLF